MFEKDNKHRITCSICKSTEMFELDVGSLLFPQISYAPDFHQYKNFACPNCGIVAGKPEPSDQALNSFYNSSYRRSDLAFDAYGKTVDTPIDFHKSGRSFQRAINFFKTIETVKSKHPEVEIKSTDTILDVGSYQGLFLHAVQEIWGCDGVATDYNEKGINFAKQALGLKSSWVTKDIYTDKTTKKVKFVTMLHVLEHLRDPLRYLNNLKENVLMPNGILYIEVPNLFGAPLNDPTHFFTFSHQSLDYLLNAAGFEILNLTTSGDPVDQTFYASNREENLICLAKVCSKGTPMTSTKMEPREFARQINRSYQRHSRAAVMREIKKVMIAAVKCTGYFVFVVVLERISRRLAYNLARISGFRKS